MLGFATVDDADLTDHRRRPRFVTADILTTKELFAHQASTSAPLVRADQPTRLPPASTATSANGFFLDMLRRGFSEDEARHQLDIAIDWGRYGELFDYDANTRQLIAEPLPAPDL